MVLHCRNLTVRPAGDLSATPILDNVDAWFKPGAMNAIIGPSGCGKTTLVKAMLGLAKVDNGGEVWFDSEQIHEPEDLLGRVGFAPQFSIAQPKLTVEECLRFGLELCVEDSTVRAERLERVLGLIGLSEHRHKRVESLSGGQLRRLGLGLELTLDPPVLICDEVTSGLDPVSENQLLDFLRTLADERGKTLMCIIHSLAKLTYFDWITVVYAGRVIFQGDNGALCEYFGIKDSLQLYDALYARTSDYWNERWAQSQKRAGETHVDSYSSTPSSDGVDFHSINIPGVASQFLTLLRRRLLLFSRDLGYISLIMAITFGFPIIVVIFALGGLPQISSPPLETSLSFDAIVARVNYTIEAANSAGLVTSLVMFQVILLMLMGANNGAREIAAERPLYEKERLSGLRPSAYTASKLAFTGLLAVFQGLWMTAFVKVICVFPGPWSQQLVALAFSCVAMTWVCLAFSAWMTSPEKATTLSIYLVGFQLPLSGVVLALPDYLVWVFRPFINAYWGWSGYFSSMQQERIYDAYTMTNPHAVVIGTTVACVVLAVHSGIGALAVWLGCRQRRWNA